MLHDFSDSQTKSNRQKMSSIQVSHVDFISWLAVQCKLSWFMTWQGILSYRSHNAAPRADVGNEINSRDHWQLL